MKKIMMLTLFLFITAFVSEKEARNSDVNFGLFYSSLNPYGEWIYIDYDVAVWKPYGVSRNWAPYSRGHWEYTSYGWYWESYEPFGWATYHYGRWFYDDYHGWVWLPGYTWGPSWVEWRYNDYHIGWAPLPPYAGFDMYVGIHFSVNYRTSYHHWHFVSYDRFCHRNVYNHFVPVHYKSNIYRKTKYRTNYHYDRGRVINEGIDRRLVESRAGTRITERSIERTTDLREYTDSRNSSSRSVIAYRPNEKEAEKFRDIRTDNIRNSTGRTSLKREMITFRDREEQVERTRELKLDDKESIKREVERRPVERNDNRYEPKRNDRDKREIKYEQPTRSAKSYENNNVPENKVDRKIKRENVPEQRKEIKFDRNNSRKNETRKYERPETAPQRQEINRSSSKSKSEVKKSAGSRKNEMKSKTRTKSSRERG